MDELWDFNPDPVSAPDVVQFTAPPPAVAVPASDPSFDYGGLLKTAITSGQSVAGSYLTQQTRKIPPLGTVVPVSKARGAVNSSSLLSSGSASTGVIAVAAVLFFLVIMHKG